MKNGVNTNFHDHRVCAGWLNWSHASTKLALDPTEPVAALLGISEM